MSKIRINTEHVATVGQHLLSGSERLAGVAQEVERALAGLDSGAWDGVSRARAEPMFAQVRPEARYLAQRLDELSRLLTRVAEAFSQEDAAAAHNFGEMDWVEWYGPDRYDPAGALSAAGLAGFYAMAAGEGHPSSSAPPSPPPSKSGAPLFILPLASMLPGGYKFMDTISYTNGMINDGWRGVHIGTDYGPTDGDNHVMASTTGTVVFSGEQRGYGHYVIVEYPADTLPPWATQMAEYKEGDSAYAIYAHLADPVEELPPSGTPVTNGTVLGTMGQTGNASGVHLHTEVRFGAPGMDVRASGDIRWYDATVLTPVDPENVFHIPNLMAKKADMQ